MAKQVAYKDYVVSIEDNGSIIVTKNGKQCDNAKDALGEIAKQIFFDVNAKWNIRQLGARVLKEIVMKTTNVEYKEKKLHTYYIRLESSNLWRFDSIELDNVAEDELTDAIEASKGWANMVGSASILSCLKEDIDNGYVFGYDEDDVKKLSSIIGENIVHMSEYFPDAEDEFAVVVTNENDEEIETIESSDISSFNSEQCYPIKLDDYDEDDDEYAVVKKYLECNNHDKEFAEHTFRVSTGGKWFWLNVQRCMAEEYPRYKLDIQDEFNPCKISFKKTLVEEAIDGRMSIEVITEVLYDGKVLEIEDSALVGGEESTNFFIKMDKKGFFPEKVYDITRACLGLE